MKEKIQGQQHFFAVDLGATSGRTIIGTLSAGSDTADGDNRKVEVQELTRFDNPITVVGGHHYWNLFALYGEILRGLRLAAQREIPLTSIGIDTWGVDFVCIGTCAALGTVLGPVLLQTFFPEQNALASLTTAVIAGVVVTLLGIAIIGVAGGMKAATLSDEEKRVAVKEFNFPKGVVIALLAGFMSGCFNVGLEFGKDINFG